MASFRRPTYRASTVEIAVEIRPSKNLQTREIGPAMHIEVCRQWPVSLTKQAAYIDSDPTRDIRHRPA